MKRLTTTFFLYGTLAPFLAFSASPGALGLTSTGTVGVSIIIPALVQISGLSDITLGSTSTFPATGATTACIYSNVTTPAVGDYFITASSQNVLSNAFRVTNGTEFITYTAFWGNTSATTPAITLASGTKSVVQTGGSSTSTICGGGSNANFNISFSAAQVAGAPAATYTDLVTLLITSS